MALGYRFLLLLRWSFWTCATSGSDEAILDEEGKELFHDIAHSTCHCIAVASRHLLPAKAQLGVGGPRPHSEVEE